MDDLTGWATLILAGVTGVLVIVTAVNVMQTKHMVNEMKKDRRRQFLERALETIISPIYEILRRGLQHPESGKNFYLGPDDVDNIRKWFRQYGHYLNVQLYDKLRRVIVDQPGKQNWDYAEMDRLYEDFTREFGSLRKEIQDLATYTEI